MRFQNPFSDPLTTKGTWENPYLKKLRENSNQSESSSLKIFWGEHLKNKQGNWRQTIAAQSKQEQGPSLETPLIAELGCHLGKTLVQLASEHRKHFFVGIDVTYKRVIRSAEKLHKLQLSNSCCLMLDARYLADVFAHEELNGVITFFPDPWHKTSQRKNRLLNLNTLMAIHNCLKLQGFFWFKTDSYDYFNSVNEICSKVGLEPNLTPVNTPFLKDYSSSFEQLFIHQGTPIYSQLFFKK